VNSQPPKGVTVEGDVVISSSIDIEDRAGREIGKARMQDSNGTLIDPATETTLADVESNTSDAATETTLSAILTELEEQTTVLNEIETNTSS
jgi:hypothetical protein